MRVFRIAFILLIMAIPFCTLVHRNDLHHWDTQRSAMAAPDELSYLLMGRHFAQGGGISVKEALGRDTFYPPGYPLLIAGWAWVTHNGGVTAPSAHLLNTA